MSSEPRPEHVVASARFGAAAHLSSMRVDVLLRTRKRRLRCVIWTPASDR